MTGRERTTLRSVAPGSPMCATAAGHQGAVARRGHGRGEARHAGVGVDVGGGAVLPDDRVEELVGLRAARVSAGPTAVAQRRVTPSASREIPMVKRGMTRCPAMASTKGSAPSATAPDPRQPHRVVAGDGRQRRGGIVRRDQLRGAPADQGQPGAVEEHGGAAVELQRVGPVLERHGAGVEARPSRRAGAGGDHAAG